MADTKLLAGPAIRRLRRKQGLTQAALADILGVSPSYLNLIERNQRPLTAGLMLALADRFDIDPRTFAAAEPGGGVDALRRRLTDPLFADLDVSGLLGVEDEDIGLVELLLGGELQTAIGLGPALIEQRHPFLEELREVMRTRPVRLRAGADDEAQRLSTEKCEVRSEE